MFQLIYSSIESRAMDTDDLRDIVKKAVSANKAIDVTGLLLYVDGFILQLLEGEKEIVLNLYQKIKKDPRHYDVETILEIERGKRMFPDWSMGFKSIHTNEIRNFDGEVITSETLRSRCRIKPNLVFDLMATFIEKG